MEELENSLELVEVDILIICRNFLKFGFFFDEGPEEIWNLSEAVGGV